MLLRLSAVAVAAIICRRRRWASLCMKLLALAQEASLPAAGRLPPRGRRGYNTEKERQRAAANPRIEVVDIARFAELGQQAMAGSSA